MTLVSMHKIHVPVKLPSVECEKKRKKKHLIKTKNSKVMQTRNLFYTCTSTWAEYPFTNCNGQPIWYYNIVIKRAEWSWPFLDCSDLLQKKSSL